MDPNGAIRVLPSEQISSFELGTKFRLFDGHLSGDISLYHFRYSNFQTFQRTQDRLVPVNAGTADATGIEAQGNWRLFDGLMAFGSYAYNKARLTSGAYDGNRFRNAPDHKFSIGFEAVLPTSIADISLVPLYTWQSKIFFSDDNDRADLQIRSRPAFNDVAVDEVQSGYGLFNVRLGFKVHNSPFDISLIGENLADTKYIVDAGNTGDSFGTPTFIVGQRRTMRVEVRAKF